MVERGGMNDDYSVDELLAELQRRNPEADWNRNPACPDCGSMDHFECNGDSKYKPGDVVSFTLAPAMKAEIDSLSRMELCRKWRFAEDGDPMMQGDAGAYLAERLKALGGFSPAISKALGWG